MDPIGELAKWNVISIYYYFLFLEIYSVHLALPSSLRSVLLLAQKNRAEINTILESILILRARRRQTNQRKRQPQIFFGLNILSAAFPPAGGFGYFDFVELVAMNRSSVLFIKKKKVIWIWAALHIYNIYFKKNRIKMYYFQLKHKITIKTFCYFLLFCLIL